MQLLLHAHVSRLALDDLPSHETLPLDGPGVRALRVARAVGLSHVLAVERLHLELLLLPLGGVLHVEHKLGHVAPRRLHHVHNTEASVSDIACTGGRRTS